MLFYDRIRWARMLLFVVVGIILTGSTAIAPPSKKHYRIEDGSKLYLKGTSNVNSFTCDCEESYQRQTVDVERNGGCAKFSNADLYLKSKNFDCHNRKIDADMQKALKADQYPNIKITLCETWQNAKCLEGQCKDWFDVQAKVKITITNVTKEETIPAKAKAIGPNRFQLQGKKALQMSAYGVIPPEAMFGMIKVNDWITFNFDLIVQVDEVQ